jgi:hypothetical protein
VVSHRDGCSAFGAGANHRSETCSPASRSSLRGGLRVGSVHHHHHANAVVEGAVHLNVVDTVFLQPGKQLGLGLPLTSWAAVPLAARADVLERAATSDCGPAP